MSESRELTGLERAAIRKLVVSKCANYSREYGCLPLDCECYMINKWWIGAYCRYFQSAVLPLDPALEATLRGHAVDMRPCAYCGNAFPAHGKRIYCSSACAGRAKKIQQRGYMRKRRGNN